MSPNCIISLDHPTRQLKVLVRTIRLLIIALVVCCDSFYAAAQSPPVDVHVRLLLADGKTSFRIGDPIKLVMEFSADTPGYNVDVIQDQREQSLDTVVVSPDTGVTNWLDEMTEGQRYMRDVLSFKDLSKTPVQMIVTLNDSLRFDQPGHYSVKVKTQRVKLKARLEEWQPIELSSNEVEFDVREMTKDEEAAEVKRLAALLDVKRDLQSAAKLTEDLSYLTGEISTREKVRRFLDTTAVNYSSNLWFGLFVARDRNLVLQLLENALRDSNQPVTVSLLRAANSLRALKERNGAPFQQKVRSALVLEPRKSNALDNVYLTEVIAGLNKRSGASLVTTAMTFFTSVDRKDENRATLIWEARRVLTQHFSSLHAFDQEYLLRVFWDDLRSPAMTGPLKQLLQYGGVSSKNVTDTALNCLIDLSAEDARKYLIKQICDPTALTDPEIVRKIAESPLPEVDSCLLAQLKQYSRSGQGRDRVFFEHRSSFLARVATDSIYQEVMNLYRERSASLSLESRAALLAYFAKYNEGEAVPLIEQVLQGLEPNTDFNFLPRLTSFYYSQAIGEIIKQRLDGDNPQTVSNAAYLLGRNGSKGDELLLLARLDRWRKEWGDRVSEANTNQQGMIEREIVWALVNGKQWKFSPERIRELKLSCVTEMCKTSNRVQ